MNNKIDLRLLNSHSLQKEDYQVLLPEFYKLKTVVENNAWHLKQNVFDHAVAVIRELLILLKSPLVRKSKKVNQHLVKKIGKRSRKELLIVAIILHDIAKPETMVKDANNNTKCYAHELIGSIFIDNFSTRFNLDKKETGYVKKIVCYHGFTNDILTLIIKKANALKYFTYFKKVVGDIYLELLLLMYADMAGSDLKKLNPQEFKQREKLIINAVEN